MIIKIISNKVDYLELFFDEILGIIFSEKPKAVSTQNNPNKYQDTEKTHTNAFGCRIGRRYRVDY